MSDESLPKTIGKYKITKLLGEGAMGVVYDAMDEMINRRVAVKTLHKHLLTKRNEEEFLERFKTEAISAARCIHPNIVMVLEYGEDNNVPYIAMEYVDGMSLQDIIHAKKKISLKNILMIISQLLKAIHAAHSLGVVHRDIKTANIILCKSNNTVKLADFGIARLTENNSMTLTGAIIGTPRYMSPEQMFGLKVDHRSDLFSIAFVFIELLAQLPEQLSIQTSVLSELDLPPNNQINYNCSYPTALIPILKKGLANKPDDRFQSAKAFATALQKVLPQLRKSSSDDATRLNPPLNSTDSSQIPEQLASEDIGLLTQVLTDYLGPVARNIVKEKEDNYGSLSELATALSHEIPKEQQRQDFMRSWEKQSTSGTSITRDNSQPSQSGSYSTANPSIRINDNMIQQISEDYINYVGPFASRLVDHYCSISSDKDSFLQNLAAEIPEQHDREEFIKKWELV